MINRDLTVVGTADGYEVLGLRGVGGNITTRVGESSVVSRRSVVFMDGTAIEPLTEEEMALERQVNAARKGRSKKEFG